VAQDSLDCKINSTVRKPKTMPSIGPWQMGLGRAMSIRARMTGYLMIPVSNNELGIKLSSDHEVDAQNFAEMFTGS
jgi:hypothetical protein